MKKLKPNLQFFLKPSRCSSLRTGAKFSFKFDLCRLNLQIEILNFYRLVKIVIEKFGDKKFKLAFGRSNL